MHLNVGTLKKSAIVKILGKLGNESVNFLLNANMKLEPRLALQGLELRTGQAVCV
jgi:hypothetical protein